MNDIEKQLNDAYKKRRELQAKLSRQLQAKFSRQLIEECDLTTLLLNLVEWDKHVIESLVRQLNEKN